ncbi:right-handed parallel beta-helix repeat-containing protein [Bosea sp. BK604]|uniref:right-handed parallel beta-helix repeat-containing protein n=1 Tax=Bosea sp. BK604 TaxID=2512180 RepID=UPI00104D9CDB|nr:right-handed parallel beta-helix repeat-containing protein [Bosea sp. BK604]TCR61526.1 parallel beta helix pectate lyase-like protein [Bosea sp. BK604]
MKRRYVISRRSLIRSVSTGLLASSALAVRPVLGVEAGDETSHYVAPTGDDLAGDGSIGAPWATLQRAFSAVRPGATIFLRGGTYNLTGPSGIHLMGRSGTSEKLITIRNYATEAVVLNGSGLTSTKDSYSSPTDAGGYVLSLYNVSNITIKGLDIRNGPMGGVIVNGGHSLDEGSHGNIFENLRIHGNGWNGSEGKGFSLYGYATDNLLVNCDSYFNADLEQTNADGYQISPWGPASTGNALRGCRAWQNSDDGFDLFNVNDNTSPAPVMLSRCWAWRNGFLADGSQGKGEGNGFKLGGQRQAARGNASGTSGGHTVTDCYAWSNVLNGFTDNSATIANTVVNCTAYDNCRSRDEYGRPSETWTYDFYFPTPAGHVLIDNVAFQPAGREARVAAENTDRNNSWTRSPPLSSASFVSLADAAATGRRMEDGSLPETAFLRLAAGSSLGKARPNAAPL